MAKNCIYCTRELTLRPRNWLFRNFFRYVAMKKVAKSKIVARRPVFGLGIVGEAVTGDKSEARVWLLTLYRTEAFSEARDETFITSPSSKINGFSSNIFFILLKKE